MRNAFITSLITSISILFMTCGETEIKPPPTGGPGPPPVSGPITDEQRLAVLKECSDFVNALGDLTSDDAQQTLVAWLKTHPEFEEADTLGGNVWAYFRDGRVAMFVPDVLNDGRHDGGRIGIPDIEGKNKTYPTAGRTTGQPGSNTVKLFHGHGKGYFDFRPLIKDLFANSKTQYTVTLEEATIENLKNTNDLGVFFISTHGGMGLKKPRAENKRLYGLWTTDTTSLESERTYEGDLNSNYLVYMHAIHNDGVKEWHYGITDQYVRNYAYMNFAENAVLYIHACSSIGPNATALRESMEKKAKGGKATYIGWTSVSDNFAGEAAALFVFDRMLGTNKHLPAHDGPIDPEDPEQRPFDFAAIFKNMRNFVVDGYPVGVSRSGGSLAYHSTHTTEIILTPSIEYIGIGDYESKMYIKGLFGDDPSTDGKVSVGGVSVPIASWSSHQIICDLPTTGPGSIGDVVVSVRGNKSNVVPLSEWIIPLELTKEEIGGKLEAHLNLRIRADVHPYRSKPGEAPKTDRPDTTGVGDFPRWPFAIGSTGSYNVGGQRQADCRIDRCQFTESRSAVSRNGVLPYATNTGDVGFGAFYKWSPDMKTLYVGLIVKVNNISFEEKTHAVCEGQSPTDSDQTLDGDMKIDIPTLDLSVLQLHVGENYTIQSGEVVNSQDVTWGICEKPETIIMKAKWPNVSSTFPPKSDTQSRFGGD